MPSFSPIARAACALALASSLSSLAPHAAAQTVASNESSANSGLDAQLFYQLLIGEIEFRSGEAGTAYQVLLDAARKTRATSTRSFKTQRFCSGLPCRRSSRLTCSSSA